MTSGRATARIGDLCEQIRGVSYSKDDARRSPASGYLPVLRANNIREDGLNFDDLVYVPERCVGAKQLLRQGDIVVAASSGSIDVVGKAAQCSNDFRGGFGAFCKVLRPSSPKADPAYIAHFFRTPAYRRTVSALAAGANINNLRNEHLDDLTIPLPPLPEQRGIAAILDKADALRAKRREAIAKLDQLLQSVFLDMFGDPVTNPKGLPVTTLEEISDKADRINYGVVQPGGETECGVPLIRVGDIEGGKLIAQGLKRIAPEVEAIYARSRIKGNEILVSCVGSIGTIARVPDSAIGFNIARAITRVPVQEAAYRPFIEFCLRTPGVQRYFKEKTRTVSQPTLNVEFVKQTPVLAPPTPEKARFCALAARVEGQARAVRLALSKLDLLFSSLQQTAFSEIR